MSESPKVTSVKGEVMTAEKCATTGCQNDASWIPIREGNVGMRVRRCRECCDAIADRDIPAGRLYSIDQLRKWSSIPKDYRTTIDGKRYVLALTEHGTSLVPWYGQAKS